MRFNKAFVFRKYIDKWRRVCEQKKKPHVITNISNDTLFSLYTNFSTITVNDQFDILYSWFRTRTKKREETKWKKIHTRHEHEIAIKTIIIHFSNTNKIRYALICAIWYMYGVNGCYWIFHSTYVMLIIIRIFTKLN